MFVARLMIVVAAAAADLEKTTETHLHVRFVTHSQIYS